VSAYSPRIAAFRLIVSRSPTSAEHQRVVEFVKTQTERLVASDEERSERLPIPMPLTMKREHGAAWTDVCVALFNSNAFVYVD
jgi:hypothetical protein